LNSKIVLSKRTSAIFLAIVLIAGTIALSFASFMIGSAQAQPYYGNDNRYNSYEPDYGMNNDRKSYENDNIYEQSQYQSSYKPDYYKPAYPSYDKDDSRDKSKKDSSSDIINKIKCTTNNIVINGNNTGDVNIGNNGQVPTAEEGGYLGASSSAGSGYGGSEGYSKQGKGFDCIINNNNTINNIVAGAGGGNVTDGNVTEPKPTCGECFSRLTPQLQNSINMFLNDEVNDIVLSPTLTIPGSITGISSLCTFFNTVDPIPLTQAQITAFINMALQELPGGSTIPNAQAQLQALVLCLIEADIIVVV
jgi:hypothetical protein